MEQRQRIKIRTTLPVIPPNDSRDEIHTPRLIIRVPRISDVPALHKLRIQHEVMKYSMEGADKTIEDTRRSLDVMLPPNDTNSYRFHIFEKDTGDLVGKGGMHSITGRVFGWPEVGYSFKQEAWGKGYATEFLTAFLQSWWSLPRSEVEIEVDPTSLDAQALETGDGPVVEMLVAVVDVGNPGSKKVLEKTGFKQFKQWTTKDIRLAYKGEDVTLVGLVAVAPAQERN
ncbi:acetyltransferase domain-containing protein [Trichoderma sp. SZMC 28013]